MVSRLRGLVRGIVCKARRDQNRPERTGRPNLAGRATLSAMGPIPASKALKSVMLARQLPGDLRLFSNSVILLVLCCMVACA